MQHYELRVRPTLLSAFYALMPYLLADAYLKLVVNWPGMESQLSKLDIVQLQKIAGMNFTFILYSIGVIMAILLERILTPVVVHILIVLGFLLGIGIVYATIVPLQVLVHPYISIAIIINTIIAIYAMFMFYYGLIRRWSRRTDPVFADD